MTSPNENEIVDLCSPIRIVKTRTVEGGIIEILSDDDDEDAADAVGHNDDSEDYDDDDYDYEVPSVRRELQETITMTALAATVSKVILRATPPLADDDEEEKDDAEMVTPGTNRDGFRPITNNCNSNDNNDDDNEVRLVGSIGTNVLADFPHAREDCVLMPFDDLDSIKCQRFCTNCFCYVCDVPAKHCQYWNRADYSYHCLATAKKEFWTTLREHRRQEKGSK